jgi:hypothetical protein
MFQEWHFRGAWRVTAEDAGGCGLREGTVIHKKCRPSSDLVSKGPAWVRVRTRAVVGCARAR